MGGYGLLSLHSIGAVLAYSKYNTYVLDVYINWAAEAISGRSMQFLPTASTIQMSLMFISTGQPRPSVDVQCIFSLRQVQYRCP